MKTSTASIRANILRNGLPVAFAIGVLGVLSAPAQAADLDEITISAPTEKTVGRDLGTNAPIEDVTVTAHVASDPTALTTSSGVALLKDSVVEAARTACTAAAPFTPDDGTCVRQAVQSAQPQIDAAIAQARSSSAKG